MLFKLLLVTVLNGSVYTDVLDYDMSREDCVSGMIELNKVAAENEQVVCYGESYEESL